MRIHQETFSESAPVLLPLATHGPFGFSHVTCEAINSPVFGPSRSKKIKCVMVAGAASGPGAKCDACTQAATVCLFSDRDRYHAERGVSVSENARTIDPPNAPSAPDPDAARRRKRRPSNPHTQKPESLQPGGLDHGYSLNIAANDIRNSGQVESNDLPVACDRGVLKRIVVPFFR